MSGRVDRGNDSAAKVEGFTSVEQLGWEPMGRS